MDRVSSPRDGPGPSGAPSWTRVAPSQHPGPRAVRVAAVPPHAGVGAPVVRPSNVPVSRGRVRAAGRFGIPAPGSLVHRTGTGGLDHSASGRPGAPVARLPGPVSGRLPPVRPRSRPPVGSACRHSAPGPRGLNVPSGRRRPSCVAVGAAHRHCDVAPAPADAPARIHGRRPPAAGTAPARAAPVSHMPAAGRSGAAAGRPRLPAPGRPGAPPSFAGPASGRPGARPSRVRVRPDRPARRAPRTRSPHRTPAGPSSRPRATPGFRSPAGRDSAGGRPRAPAAERLR